MSLFKTSRGKHQGSVLNLECGGKRSWTPLWFSAKQIAGYPIAPSPLHSAGVLQKSSLRSAVRSPN